MKAFSTSKIGNEPLLIHRLADAYKVPETDKLFKVDYIKFCKEIETGDH